VIGGISLVVLAIALFAVYRKAGGRLACGVCRDAVIAQFFNVLVLIVQSFMKIRVLHAMAPTGEEAVVKITQVGALVLCIVLGVVAGRSSRPRRSESWQGIPSSDRGKKSKPRMDGHAGSASAFLVLGEIKRVRARLARSNRDTEQAYA